MTAASAGTTACIIGAGASGITSAQVLAARGIDFDWFEIGSEIGGNWRYDNDNGVSSAYRSLHINTSRQAMEYAAFPMPDSLPDYPSHWQIADYFDAFVDHFGLRERVTFRTEVTRVVPQPGGGLADTYEGNPVSEDDHLSRSPTVSRAMPATGGVASATRRPAVMANPIPASETVVTCWK